MVGRTSTEAPGLNPAAAGGLVICAENVRESVDDAGAAGELRAIDALGLRFPSPEMVTAAAALFEPAPPWSCGAASRGVEPESSRFRISIGPGVVRLWWTNPVRAEKAAARAVGHHQRDVDDAKFHVRNDLDHEADHGDQAVGSLIRRSPTEDDRCRTGGVITEWSRKSRSSMCRTFAELDYTPLVESERVPAMVTLTYPGDWEVVAPDGASVKRHMALWRKRFQREYDEPARYIWKLEFQRRGAPHIHLWMALPMSPGRSGRGFAQWMSETWAQVVDHPDAEQKARHRLAGTAIDVLSGLKARDPKRLAIYFTKHSSPNMHATRSTSTSCLNCGGSPVADLADSGARTDSRRPSRSSRSPKTLTWLLAGSCGAGHAVKRCMETRSAASPLRWCRARPCASFRASITKPALWSTGGFGDEGRSVIKVGWPAGTHWSIVGHILQPGSPVPSRKTNPSTIVLGPD